MDIVSSSEIKTENKKMTLNEWQRRWNNTKDNQYKNIVPTISKELNLVLYKAACITTQA